MSNDKYSIYRKTYNNKTLLAGPRATLISVLKGYLNFTMELIEPEDGLFGTFRQVDNSSTGLFHLITEGKADMVGNNVFPNLDRSQVMSFVEYDRSRLRIYSSKRQSIPRSILQVFAKDYWVALLALAFMFSIIFYVSAVAVSTDSPSFQLISSISLSVGATLPLDVGPLIVRSLENKVYYRILLFTIFMFGSLNFSIFQSEILTTSLVKDSSQIDTLEDLLNAEGCKLYLFKESFHQQLFEEINQQCRQSEGYLQTNLCF